ncbi:hypothetical protein HELRODRAFT_93972, partial [Helobdella robusta]|uniref:Uncharacterized protein n=1 Tax=Helobdella robusta TaxID=6412 RepID=T1G8Y3_HELRO
MEATAKNAVHFNVTQTYSPNINFSTTFSSTGCLNVSTSSTLYSNVITTSWNLTNVTEVGNHVCLKVLYWTLPNSHVRLWDLLILIPNVFFMAYLLFNISVLLPLLRRSNRQIFTVLFFLVFVSHILSITRCVISMSVHSSTYDVIDRAMWLIMRFFLLATELSVVTFGFFFG